MESFCITIDLELDKEFVDNVVNKPSLCEPQMVSV